MNLHADREAQRKIRDAAGETSHEPLVRAGHPLRSTALMARSAESAERFMRDPAYEMIWPALTAGYAGRDPVIERTFS